MKEFVKRHSFVVSIVGFIILIICGTLLGNLISSWFFLLYLPGFAIYFIGAYFDSKKKPDNFWD